jgi:uncharacterized integral membrane protein
MSLVLIIGIILFIVLPLLFAPQLFAGRIFPYRRRRRRP